MLYFQTCYSKSTGRVERSNRFLLLTQTIITDTFSHSDVSVSFKPRRENNVTMTNYSSCKWSIHWGNKRWYGTRDVALCCLIHLCRVNSSLLFVTVSHCHSSASHAARTQIFQTSSYPLNHYLYVFDKAADWWTAIRSSFVLKAAMTSNNCLSDDNVITLWQWERWMCSSCIGAAASLSALCGAQPHGKPQEHVSWWMIMLLCIWWMLKKKKQLYVAEFTKSA